VANLPRDPLTGTDRLLVDGTNLLYVLSRTPDAAPQAALVGKLRGFVPPSIGIELIFDGMPDRGMRGERVASGLIVRHAGRRSADELLMSLVDEARAAVGVEGLAGLLIITDDRALSRALRDRGARTAGAAWLIARLDQPKLSSPSVGNKRPPSTSRSASKGSSGGGGAEGDDPSDGPSPEDAHVGWKPGRGATTKRGNPRRRRPSSGRMPA
jgi:hypothetical protein